MIMGVAHGPGRGYQTLRNGSLFIQGLGCAAGGEAGGKGADIRGGCVLLV